MQFNYTLFIPNYLLIFCVFLTILKETVTLSSFGEHAIPIMDFQLYCQRFSNV